jgi:hypothetical protein
MGRAHNLFIASCFQQANFSPQLTSEKMKRRRPPPTGKQNLCLPLMGKNRSVYMIVANAVFVFRIVRNFYKETHCVGNKINVNFLQQFFKEFF